MYPLEQTSVTSDQTDYLWYGVTVNVSSEDVSTGYVNLTLNCADMCYIYLDHDFVNQITNVDSVYSSLLVPVSQTGQYNLGILSMTMGLINYGPFLERYQSGIAGQVWWGSTVISVNMQWSHCVGLLGEAQFYATFPQFVDWQHDNVNQYFGEPLSWYYIVVSPPPIIENVAWALDLHTMGKGAVWVNGNHLGRYWNVTADSMPCEPCDYRGAYDPSRCRTGCGQPSQIIYHVPDDYFTHTPPSPPSPFHYRSVPSSVHATVDPRLSQSMQPLIQIVLFEETNGPVRPDQIQWVALQQA